MSVTQHLRPAPYAGPYANCDVRIPAPLHKALKKHAQRSGLTYADLVTGALLVEIARRDAETEARAA